MKRAEDSPEAGGPCYTLYLEYLGGLVPILKGRRISKLRPEFVIMDPKTDSKTGGPYRVCIMYVCITARKVVLSGTESMSHTLLTVIWGPHFSTQNFM